LGGLEATTAYDQETGNSGNNGISLPSQALFESPTDQQDASHWNTWNDMNDPYWNDTSYWNDMSNPYWNDMNTVGGASTLTKCSPEPTTLTC